MTPMEQRMIKSLNRAMALRSFAELVLAKLERDKDWGSDTFDQIASYAVELKLARVGKDSMFKRVLPRAKK